MFDQLRDLSYEMSLFSEVSEEIYVKNISYEAPV